MMQRERIERDERLFRNLGIRLKYLSVAIAGASLLVTVTVALLHHG